MQVQDRVTFVGATDDIVRQYHSADYFVLPTRHDPCSLVVLEALACGLPVISTRQNGSCDVMKQNVHGIILNDAENVDALSSAMQQMNDPAIRNRMASACAALRETLSYDYHLDRLLELYARFV